MTKKPTDQPTLRDARGAELTVRNDSQTTAHLHRALNETTVWKHMTTAHLADALAPAQAAPAATQSGTTPSPQPGSSENKK